MRAVWIMMGVSQQLRIRSEAGSLVVCEVFKLGNKNWQARFPLLPLASREVADGGLPDVAARAEAIRIIRDCIHDMNDALTLIEVKGG